MAAGLESNKNNTNEQENRDMILHTGPINYELFLQSVQKFSNHMHYVSVNQDIPIFLLNDEGKNGDNKSSRLVHFIAIKQFD